MTKKIDHSITNPLPIFDDSFVGRTVRNGKLYIEPILPKPHELRAFFHEAEKAGFVLGRMISWSGNWAPRYAWKPVSTIAEMLTKFQSTADVPPTTPV